MSPSPAKKRLLFWKIAIPAGAALLYWLGTVLYNPPTMHTLAESGSGFSVQMPCKPQSKSSTQPGDLGPVRQTDYFCESGGVSYVAGFADLPHDLVAPLVKAQNTEQIFERHRDHMLARANAKLLNERSLAQGPYGGRSYEMLVQQGKQKHRLRIDAYLVGERLYLQNFVRPEPPSYNQELYSNRFAQSFRLTPR